MGRVAPGTYMGRRTVHQDASIVNKTSPQGSVTTTPVEFVPPANSVVAQFKGISGAIRLGEDDDLSEGYEKYLENEWSNPIPCHDQHSIYVRADSGTVSVEFRFELT